MTFDKHINSLKTKLIVKSKETEENIKNFIDEKLSNITLSLREVIINDLKDEFRIQHEKLSSEITKIENFCSSKIDDFIESHKKTYELEDDLVPKQKGILT